MSGNEELLLESHEFVGDKRVEVARDPQPKWCLWCEKCLSCMSHEILSSFKQAITHGTTLLVLC